MFFFQLLAKHASTKGFAFDYKLFKVLPQIFPALCSAVCMLKYPIYLEEFGLYYGFFAAIVLYGIYFQYLRQPTILKHQSRIALGWSIGAILSIAWSHWHACYPHISLVASGLFYVALCLTLTFFFRCIISKPASLTKGDNSDRYSESYLGEMIFKIIALLQTNEDRGAFVCIR